MITNDFEFPNYEGMSFSYPEFEILRMPEDLKVFELAARTCYRSEDKINEDSDEKLFHRILSKNHTAMIEFVDDLVVRFKTNRGVSHELVRMRLCSFAQESTRYVTYNKMNFIIPWWLSTKDMEEIDTEEKALFMEACITSSKQYKRRIETGWSAQKARGCLINDISTLINVKTNIREWMHIFDLRCDSPAHPDMRVLMCGLFMALGEKSEIFKILTFYKKRLYDDLLWFAANYTLVPINDTKYTIVNNNGLV